MCRMLITGIILHKMPLLLHSSSTHFGVNITQLPVHSANLLPSVLILSAVLTNAKRVALNITVPSLFSGIFMETRRCGVRRRKTTITLHQGLNFVLPYTLMMFSRPATPFTSAFVTCGFGYATLRVLLISIICPSSGERLPWGLSPTGRFSFPQCAYHFLAFVFLVTSRHSSKLIFHTSQGTCRLICTKYVTAANIYRVRIFHWKRGYPWTKGIGWSALSNYFPSPF